MIVGFPRMQRLWPRVPSWVPQWLRLIQEAESAAAAAGASLWYVPPEGYAPRAVNGPFVGSSGLISVPDLGSGPVGFLRDARSGPVSSPELVTNGDFANGATGWGLGAGWSVSGGVAVGTSASGNLTQIVAPSPVGKAYLVSLTIVTRSAGSIVPQIGGSTVTLSAPGSYSFVLTPTLNDPVLYIPGASFTGTIDNISIREIPGSHATQSTSANRPVLVAAPGAAAAAAGFCATSFDGANDVLATPALGASFGGANDRTLIVAGSMAAGSVNFATLAAIGDTDSVGAGFAILCASSGNMQISQGGADLVAPVALRGAAGNVWTARRSGSTLEAWIGGSLAATNSPGATINVTDTVLRIGAQRATPQLWAQAQIGLVCVAPVALTPSQRAPIERLGALIMGASYPGL